MKDGHLDADHYGLFTVVRDNTREQKWARWAAQAREFARRDNFVDAVARMRCLRDDISAALVGASKSGPNATLEARLKWAEHELSELQARYRSWNDAIAKRRQETIDNAEEEFAQPLPVPPPTRN